MRKFKIITSAVATLAVLIFCISMGVYAASNVTFKITSTVSFQSPDISGISIECYVVHDGYDDVLQHIYSVDENGVVNEGGASWNFSKIKKSESAELTDLGFTKRDSDDHYAPITLKFVIKHSTPLSLYAYFTKAQSAGATGEYINSDIIKGQNQTNLELVNITMDDCIIDSEGIPGKEDNDDSYSGGVVTMEISLAKDATLIKDSVVLSNYSLVVSKFKPEISNTTPGE